jgi:hypothetical protein
MQIQNINKRYEESFKLSGENFNIFNVLNLTSKELIHSKMIAMLLDPMAEHRMGDIFLNNFLNILKSRKIIVNEFFDTIIETEKVFNNGQIDILITSKNKNQIIIENKIYARDQSSQLLRYHDYNKNATLLYLTLDGHNANEISTHGLLKEGQDYQCISYQRDILEWLEICKKDTIDIPFLREVVNQYIILIKQLTGQARSKKMEKEIIELVAKDADTISSFFNIRSINSDEVAKYVIKTKCIPCLEELAKKYQLELLPVEDDYFKEEWGFYFKKTTWKNTQIVFPFGDRLKDLWYAIAIFGEDKSKDLELYLKNYANYKHHDTWCLYKEMEKYKNWTDKDVIMKLCLHDNDVILTMEDKIKELLKIIEGRIDL